MYKAIGTGRHGFHILFFSLELNKGLVGSEPVWGAWHIVDALQDGFKVNSSSVKKDPPAVRAAGSLAADAPEIKTLSVEMRQNDGKAQKKTKKQHTLDLVLRPCGRRTERPQVHTAAKAKMAKKSPGWDWCITQWNPLVKYAHLLYYFFFFVVFVGFLFTAQPTDRGFPKNIRHWMMDVVWMGGGGGRSKRKRPPGAALMSPKPQHTLLSS